MTADIPTTDPTTTRPWLLRTLDDAGDRIARALEAGVVDPVSRWTDGDRVAIVAAAHGDGVTITATRPDGTTLAPMTAPLGWTTPPPTEES